MRGLVLEQDRFKVDLRVLMNGWLAPLLSAPRTDPHVVGKALRAVMDACTDRNVRGEPLVWNRYRVFLCQEDFEVLRPLLDQMRVDLRDVLQDQIDVVGAVTVGPMDLEVLLAEDAPPPPGTIIVQVGFHQPPPALRAPGVTIRAVTDTGPVPPDLAIVVDTATRRVSEPPAPGMALLVWPGGHATLAPRVKVVLGRPHDGETSAFVALTGATNAVNRRQAWIVPTVDGAIVGRLPRANPVQVNGTLIEGGGELQVTGFPIRITLSDGALEVALRRVDPVDESATTTRRAGA